MGCRAPEGGEGCVTVLRTTSRQSEKIRISFETDIFGSPVQKQWTVLPTPEPTEILSRKDTNVKKTPVDLE